MKNSIYITLLLLGSVLSLIGSGVRSFDDREAVVRMLKDAPAIDGVLDDEAWAEGEWYTDFRLLGSPETPAAVQTEFKLAFDDQKMYLAAKIHEPNPGMLKINEFRRDGLVYMDDAFELFLDPYGDRKDYYQFITNAAGIQFEAKRSQGGLVHEVEWNNSWQVETSIEEDMWIVEMAIPLVELRLNRQSTQAWTFNVARGRRVGGEELSSYVPMVLHFHELPKFAKLEFENGDFSRFLWNIRGPYDYSIETDESEWFFSGKIKVLRNEKELQESYKVIFKQVDEKGSRIVSAVSGKFVGEELENEHQFSFPIERQNPLNVKIELVDSSNPRKVMRVEQAVLPVKYKPLEVTVIKPSYRNKIYPTEKISNIKVNVKLVVAWELVKDAKLKMLLIYKRTGDIVSEYITSEFNDSHEYLLPIGELLTGTYILDVQLLKADGSILYSQQEEIRKLRPVDNEWRFDRQVLLHNGEPFVPFGKYDVSLEAVTESDLPGGSIYMSRGLNNLDMQSYLDTVGGRGSYAIMSPLADRDYSFLMYQPGEMLTSEEKEGIRKRVQAFKSHPALLGWSIAYYPEVDKIMPQRLKEIYELLVAEDPFHPCVIVTSVTGGLVQYVDACDVIVPAAKLSFSGEEGSRQIGRIGLLMDLSKKVMGSAKATWAGFNFTNYSASAEVITRIPDFNELRNMLYQAIFEGARGFFWLDAFSGSTSPSVDLGLPFLRQELALLNDVLSASSSRVPFGVDGNSSIRIMVKQWRGQYYIFALNTSFQNQKVKIRGEVLSGYKELKVISENRSMLLGGRAFVEDEFNPYEVHIYTTELTDMGGESIPQLMKAINLTQL